MFSVGSAPMLYNEKFQGSSQLLSEVERVQLKRSPSESVVAENSVEFLRQQSKTIVKK
jgi:hypothetical protein